MFPEHQIIMSGFITDHVTLKTGVMMRKMYYILDIQIENRYFKLNYNITVLQ